VNVRNVDDLNEMLLVACEAEEWQRSAFS